MKSSIYPRTSLPALVLTCLFSTVEANNKPIADMQLNTDIKRMSVQVSQDTYWHCSSDAGFRMEANEDGSISANPDGSIPGVETGSGKKTCELRLRPRRTGVLDQIIAKVSGSGHGYSLPHGAQLPPVFASQMSARPNGSTFGLTIDRASGKLRCVYTYQTTNGSGEWTSSYSRGAVMPPGKSVEARNESSSAGACLLKDGGNTATLIGDCDSTTGGDADMCVPAGYTVRILKTSLCTVILEIRGGSHRSTSSQKRHRRYNLCT